MRFVCVCVKEGDMVCGVVVEENVRLCRKGRERLYNCDLEQIEQLFSCLSYMCHNKVI